MARVLLLLPTATYRAADFLTAARALGAEVVVASDRRLVSIGDALPGRGAAGEVLFDNRSGVRCALEHLHALGHRRIAVLRPPGSPTNDRPA